MASIPAVTFDAVWKKFRRGERHDSLRDLIPSVAKSLFGRRESDDLEKEEFWAVRDVSFEVDYGDALGIIGANGAGKSTTLKLLTRILKPTRGQCAVHGRVGALIEVAAGFHPDLTGRENVYLQGAIMGMKRVDIDRRFDEIVAFSGVERFIDTPLKRYSSGMNARLGFAVAAHLEPEVLIIDEVLAVGDSMFQARCLERIRKLKNDGVALVFVSHNLPAVESLCRRVLWLEHGATKMLGDPRLAIDGYLNSGQKTGGAAQDDGLPTRTSRHVSIRSLRLVDDIGERVSTVASGAAVSLQCVLEAETSSRQAIVGFALHSADNHRVFGENNTVQCAPITLQAGSDVSVEIRFPALSLPEGQYHFTVAAECPISGEVFDRVERMLPFEVTMRQEWNRIGSVRLSTSWSVTQTIDAAAAVQVN